MNKVKYRVMNDNTGKYVCQKFNGTVYVMEFSNYSNALQFFRKLRRTPFTNYTLVTL